MRILLGLIAVFGVSLLTAQEPAAVVRSGSHTSEVLGGTRAYRVMLPPSYATSQKRYPTVYWLQAYEQGLQQREAAFAAYVAQHEMIVVESGPFEATGDYPLYFAELVDHIDRTFRTTAAREQRAVTGFGTAGFAAYVVAGKYPDLVASASAMISIAAADVGPKNFAAEMSLHDVPGNFGGVRMLLLTPARDPIAFYTARLTKAWTEAGAALATKALERDTPDAGIAEVLDFHAASFAKPAAKPTAFYHADAFPNFMIWGWQVLSNRRQPGLTVLENVSARGFRSSVREWVPAGSVIPNSRITVISPPKTYPPNLARTVTYIRLRDGNIRRATQKADAQGRLQFELDGDAYEVGVGAEPSIAVTGYTLVNQQWATAGEPVRVQVKIWNKGGARSASGGNVTWESPNEKVKIEPASSRMFGLAPGEAATIPITVTANAGIARVVAVIGTERLAIDIPMFPAATPAPVFRISDGAPTEAYYHAVQKDIIPFGTGNGDGHAAPGENFAVLIPDGEWLRAAELFSGDACIDTGMRATDSWDDFDHSGAGARYTLASLSSACEPGKIVRVLARVLMPNYEERYYSVEFPVWYRQ